MKEARKPQTCLSESEWEAMRRAILAPSALESALQTKNSMLIRTLNELGELEKITRTSLAPPRSEPAPPALAPLVPQATAPAPAPRGSAASAPKAAAPVPTAKPNYKTGRQEYQPALGNQGLVEALLRYHRRTGRTGKSGILGRSESNNRQATSGFSAERIPEVEVETKDAGFRRSGGISAPVLRTKRTPLK